MLQYCFNVHYKKKTFAFKGCNFIESKTTVRKLRKMLPYDFIDHINYNSKNSIANTEKYGNIDFFINFLYNEPVLTGQNVFSLNYGRTKI